MALTPEALRSQQQGNPPAPPPEEKPELVDGAVEHWALYPEDTGNIVGGKQVLPAGMWPWESPVSKSARAEAGEDANVPPKDFDLMIAEALGFPFSAPPVGSSEVTEDRREKVAQAVQEHRAEQKQPDPRPPTPPAARPTPPHAAR